MPKYERGFALGQRRSFLAALSLEEIGSSTVQSRALAGMANGTVIFCMPGSTGACRTAWEGVLKDQLDSEHQPCNFVGVLRGH